MDFNLIHGDCVESVEKIKEHSIDLVVTSPPYDNLRTYNNSLSWSHKNTILLAFHLYRAIRPGGVVVWIVCDSTVKGSETGTSFRQALAFMEQGFDLNDTMIWNKNLCPYTHKVRYPNSFEYMFIFSKGKPNTVNLIKDRRNKWAGTRVHGTERQKNGKTKPMTEVQKRKNIKEYGARFNVWNIPPARRNKTGHPAIFPTRLAHDHIVSWSNKGDTVLDPFMGSGTTGVEAIKLKRNFIGIEKVKEYYNISHKRISASCVAKELRDEY